VYASVYQFEGRCTVFNTQEGPCYRCLYDSPPPPGLIPNCAEGGVLGILPGLLGTLQATEIIKLIIGIGTPLAGRLLTFDALFMRFKEFEIKKNPHCRLCSHKGPSEKLPLDEFSSCDATKKSSPNIEEISPQELHELIQHKKDFILLDVREPYEYTAYNMGGHLIPLGQLYNYINTLDRNKFYVIHCKSGERSKKAIEILKVHGFKHLKNLSGGILAWHKEIADAKI
jgi:adenylyltransferase/sulfurtransferase